MKYAGKANFTYSSIKFWNELLNEIKKISRGHKLKDGFLLDQMQERISLILCIFKRDMIYLNLICDVMLISVSHYPSWCVVML